MKFKLSISIIIVSMLITLNIAHAYASPELRLTIQTNKQKYNVGDTLTFNGTLNENGVPANDALVAVQMVDSAGYSLIYRTLNTGVIPQSTWIVEILEVTPSDAFGNPKTSFKRGQAANF